MAARVLFVVYRPEWLDNRVTDLLRAGGAAVEGVCPRLGEALPERPRAYDAVVVGGGLDSVAAAAGKPYMADLIAWTRREVAAGTPYLGLCLGAQVLAHAFGGRVARDPRGGCRYGYHGFAPTAAGREVFDGLDRALYCHYEGFEPPAGAELLATGEAFPHEAFRLDGHAYGLQFHPEVCARRLPGFLADVGPRPAHPGNHADDRQIADAARYDAAVGAWLEGFLAGWLPAAAT